MAGIQLSKVTKRYGTVEVMTDLDLEIAQGEFVNPTVRIEDDALVARFRPGSWNVLVTTAGKRA